MRRFLCVLAALALLLGGAGQVQGDIVVTNLAESPNNVDSNINAAAQSFTTGGLAETLQSVTLKLLGGAGSIDVSIFSDNADLPGTSKLHLGTLTPVGSGFADYTLNVASSFTLAANTTYWVEGNFNGSPDWAYTFSTTFSGSGTLGNFTNSNDGGATWGGPFPFSDGPYQLQVNAGAAAVPQPASLTLLAIGGVGLLGYGWRQRKRAAYGWTPLIFAFLTTWASARMAP
jgi:hypothetical protein